jgi:antitoxin (DNA-binding transcriptional repressor) of toxin-antitoxin stability system
MSVVTIHEAKTYLSRLINKVLRGEEVIIARGKKPLVKIVALKDDLPERELGHAKGKIVIASDFDGPLEDFKEYMQ